jgi:hypothetical protein
MQAYKISAAPSFLWGIGVRQYASGTLQDKQGVKLFDYYKTDSITETQKEQLRQWCPDVQFLSATPAYAPEIKAAVIAFPKAGFYRKKGMK